MEIEKPITVLRPRTQARRQDLAAGEAKNQKEGPKVKRGDHIFKIQYWMYAATGGPNVKWGDTNFKWAEPDTTAPSLATALIARNLI